MKRPFEPTIVVILGLGSLFTASSFGETRSNRPNADCGILAAEIVLKGFGYEAKEDAHFGDLRSRLPLNLADLERLFNRYNLDIRTYRLAKAPSSMIDEVNNRRSQAIVLCPVGESLLVSREHPGHYNVLIRWHGDSIEWLDPTTGLVHVKNLSDSPQLKEDCMIQFVRSSKSPWAGGSPGVTAWLLIVAGISCIGIYSLVGRQSRKLQPTDSVPEIEQIP